ncbi:MAG: hypothetical protein JNK65_07345, partial [Deltaproteobacteria bacterium]|nr:hypothetical protein [Deltaproteobacteria bacterium]
ESEPAAFILLAGLAFEQNNIEAFEALPFIQFDFEAYQNALERDFSYAAYLCLIAESGLPNVKELLIRMIQQSSQDLFFAFMGVAAEGSSGAIEALNEGISSAHLRAIVEFFKKYENYPEFLAPIQRVLKHPHFCPIELSNPFTQELLKKLEIDSLLFETQQSIVEEKLEKDYIKTLHDQWNALSFDEQSSYFTQDTQSSPIPLPFIEEKVQQILEHPQASSESLLKVAEA